MSDSRLSRIRYRLIGAVGTSRLVTRLHPVAYRRLDGAGPLGRTFGVRNVILTTTGRRTGRVRSIPLFAFEDDDRLVIVGSNAGRERDPAWVGNLRAEPRATVQAGRRSWPVRAYEAAGEERVRLWELVVAGFGGYALYQERAPRPIPLFVLEPAAMDEDASAVGVDAEPMGGVGSPADKVAG